MRTWSTLVLIVILAGCGGAPVTQSTPTPASTGITRVNVGRVTLIQSTCFADIPAPAPPGPIAVTVVNQRPVEATFTLWRIADGHTFAEAKAHADAERHLADTGQPFMGPPTWLTDPNPLNYPVAAGATAVLERVVLRGTYSVSCLAFSERANSQRVVAAAGPIEIK